MARVVLRGRFPVGSRVELVEVAGGHVMRSEGGKVLDDAEVREVDGVAEVRFEGRKVKDGGYFFVRGYTRDGLIDVRIRGRSDDDEGGPVGQAPQGPVPVTLADGTRLDAEGVPTHYADGSEIERAKSGLGPRQQDVPGDVLQRSDTPLGAATVIPQREKSPYPAVDEMKGLKASDTPEGEAVRAQQTAGQGDVPEGVQQMSDTPLGVAVPVPAQVKPMKVGEEYGEKDPVASRKVVETGAPPLEQPLDSAVTSSKKAGDEVAQPPAEQQNQSAKK